MPRSTGGRRWSVNSMGAMNRGPDSKVVEAGKVIANESVSAPVLGGHLNGSVTGNVTGSASALLVSGVVQISLSSDDVTHHFSSGNNLNVTDSGANSLTVSGVDAGNILIIKADGADLSVTIGTIPSTISNGVKDVLLVIDAAGNTIKIG